MKKVYIVFEETGPVDAEGDQPFKCYLEGVDFDALDGKADDELSAAEYWGISMFNVVSEKLIEGGAVHGVRPRGDADTKH